MCQGETFMALCEVIMTGAQFLKMLFFFFSLPSHYSGVLGRSRTGSRMCAFILALTHCHPRQRGSAAPRPF